MSEPAPRSILHVDLDAFFAAVEVREDPSLAGRPLVIGSDPKGGRGRGVVSTASYEARRHGVHSAMPISEAWRRCPQAVFLRPRHSFYEEVSARFMAILRRFTDLVEPLSIDEAFLDVSRSRRLFGDGPAIAEAIRAATRAEERLTVSVGVAPSKFLAKIASDLDKPDGLVVVDPDRVLEFLDPLPVARLFGAGKVAQQRFRELRIHTIGDVRRAPIERLVAALGENAAHHFHGLASGRDRRPVVADRSRKSLGKEMTFDVDRSDRQEVREELLALSVDVCAGLRQRSIRGRCITVKLRTSDFKTLTRRRTVDPAVDRVDQVWPVAQELFREADQTRLDIRLVGVSVSALEPRQRGLFDVAGPDPQQRMTEAMDEVSRRFGHHALRPATLLQRKRRHPDDPEAGEGVMPSTPRRPGS